MRKTSTYARKQRIGSGTYNAAAAFNAIQRCRTYTDESIPGIAITGSKMTADIAQVIVRESFSAIKNGTAKQDGEDFDVIAEALGVTWLRAIEIAGEDEFVNTMLPIIKTANSAMERCRARFTTLGRWGFDRLAMDEVDAGIELYETILQASSPAQMTAVSEQRNAILEAQA
jgi:hypothetical protein